jgi:hypothetical glycosyl hydrolase
MGQNMKSCDKGIHSGALAATWQTIVYGYGGLRWVDGKLNIQPKIPKQWNGLKYSIIYKKIKLNIEINKNSFNVWTDSKKIDIIINQSVESINTSKRKFEVKHDY